MIARVARFLRRLKKKDLVGFKRIRAWALPSLACGIGPFDFNVSLSPYIRFQKTKVFCFVPFQTNTRVFTLYEAISLLKQTKAPHTLKQRTRG